MIAADGKDYARLLLEETLSNEALGELETAIRAHIADAGSAPLAYEIELENLANLIRSHFQHLIAERKAEHPEHCLCDACVTRENMDERIALSKTFADSIDPLLT